MPTGRLNPSLVAGCRPPIPPLGLFAFFLFREPPRIPKGEALVQDMLKKKPNCQVTHPRLHVMPTAIHTPGHALASPTAASGKRLAAHPAACPLSARTRLARAPIQFAERSAPAAARIGTPRYD